jgi:D-glucosaminate-specific PTS system IIC component
MANIVLCRIDSRLIHGQVVTKWVGQSQANRIAVVSDELDADPFMKNIYLMAAPPNIKVDCFGNQSFAAAWKENQLGDGKVLVLFPSLAAVQEAVQLGFDVTTIQVGGLGGGPNRKAVFQNITLDEKDVGILSDLKNRGIQVFFQTIPEDKPQSLDDILKNSNSLITGYLTMDTLVFASLMGLYYWFARLRLGYTFSAMLLQPVVIAVFVGLLLGNMETAMIIGAGMQLVYLGVTSTPGGNVPSDPALAACISIPIAVKAGMDPNLAIALAIPFGVIGVFLDQLRRTLNAAWVHMADKHAETANMAGIMRCAFLYPALLGLVLRFPVVFAANYFGQDVVESFLKLMPHWLTHSFEIMGGILPALGFAITIMVIGKKSLLPWFIGGFFAVLYLKVDIMAMAIFGTCVAFLIKGLAKNEGAA